MGNKSLEEITRSVASYRGHLAHGHTWKLRKKVMGAFVLTHAPKNEKEETTHKMKMKVEGNDPVQE